MTAFSPSATARLYIDYTVRGFARSLQFRFATGSAAAAAAGSFRELLVSRQNYFYTSTSFNAARVSEAGSNVTNPVTFASLTGTGTGAQAIYDTPRFSSQVGRSANGSKVRYYIYGLQPSSEVPNDYRVSGEEDAHITTYWGDVADWLAELGAVTAGGQVPVLAGYINVGYNAYHQRALRG